MIKKPKKINGNTVAKISTPAITVATNPIQLLAMAVQTGADMAQLKELMDLQDRWEKKEAKKSFLAALSKFQSLCPDIKKTKTANITSRNGGGSFSYTYADLGAITKQIRSVLSDCGLSYRWEFAEINGKLKTTCFISHLDGHTEITSMEAGNDNSGAKNDIQQKGSTQTYLQRYTLIGALGLSTADEDNDAKNLKRTEKVSQPLTEEQFISSWTEVLKAVPNQTTLTTLYVKNKKIVDNSKSLQQLFKARETELKAQPATTNVTLP